MDIKRFHEYDPLSVCGELKVDPDVGLSSEEAKARLAEYGRNELPPPESTPFWKLVIKQFEDLLVLILLGAAIVSFGLALFEEGEDRLTAFVEPAVILTILILNATVGVIQETNAEASIEALRKSEARLTHALRDGRISVINASELVPGDIIVLNDGDKVPADGRVIDIDSDTEADEALLTGESHPVSKYQGIVNKPNAVPQDKHNCVFSGTLVVSGTLKAVVCLTGSETAIGEIANDLNKKDDEEEKTPLQEKLDEFGEQLSKAIALICIVVWLINIGHFFDPVHGGAVKGAIYYFKIAVALAVAAIPEGLPAVVTTCLALGTLRMAKKNAIVRSLPSVETLGCTTVICSDKTGTLTTNKMSVQKVVLIDNRLGNELKLHEFNVSGDDFSPYGDITSIDGEYEFPAVQHNGLSELSKLSVLCNEAGLEAKSDSSSGKTKVTYVNTGSPTEAALKVLAEKIGVPDRQQCEAIFSSTNPTHRATAASDYWNKQHKREQLLKFSRDRMTMSVVVKHNQTGRRFLICKGAPEQVIDRCHNAVDSQGQVYPLSDSNRAQLRQQFETIASEGLRCIAFATLDNPQGDFKNREQYASIETDMTFVGMVGMLDPPRASVKDSIARCHRAHIRVVVITGDSPITAESICRRIGLFTQHEDLTDKSFTGAQFAAMSAEQQEQAITTASLFSRVIPKHKLRIVELLKKQGQIVAMTGDGVNDAPALKAAHIGIAMGTGTDVAREASQMVLQDDNFSTIVMAVEEGRSIYNNTKQFIRYLISSNIGEVVCIFGTAALGIPEALIPVQLLWVNLVTDGLPATALGFNPPDKDIMERPPRDREEGIINGWTFFRYTAVGVYVGLATVAGFIYWYCYHRVNPISFKQLASFHQCDTDRQLFDNVDCGIFKDTTVPSTISLSILVTIEMFNALNALSENQSLFVIPPWSNVWVLVAISLSFALHFAIVYIPVLSAIFHVAPLTWAEWQIVVALSFPVVILDEFIKFISRASKIDDRSYEKKQR